MILEFTLHNYSPMKMEQTQCFETLAFKLQTPVNHPEERIRQCIMTSQKYIDINSVKVCN
jgi:hypothetical protein